MCSFQLKLPRAMILKNNAVSFFDNTCIWSRAITISSVVIKTILVDTSFFIVPLQLVSFLYAQRPRKGLLCKWWLFTLWLVYGHSPCHKGNEILNFGTHASSYYLCNKNWTIPSSLILSSNRFAIRGPGSLVKNSPVIF